jgi:hypothetical protein
LGVFPAICNRLSRCHSRQRLPEARTRSG